MRVNEDRNLRLPDGRLFGMLAEDGRINGVSGQATPQTLPLLPGTIFRDSNGRSEIRVDENGVFRSADGRALAKVDEGVLVFE